MSNVELEKNIKAHFNSIAEEVKTKPQQVANTFELLTNGATIPFIARYRKEMTGSLDEEKLFAIQDKIKYITELEERKEAILKQLKSSEKLTPELEKQIAGITSKIILEDVYAPYKPKRKTKAAIAIEAGLEPLADKFANKEGLTTEPDKLTAEFINKDKGIESAEDALKGAMNILAERTAENAEWKNYIRENEMKTARVISEVRKNYKDKKSKFETYYDYKDNVGKIPSHRVLAIRRGEKEGYLKTNLEMDDAGNLKYLKKRSVPKEPGMYADHFKNMVEDAYNRLMKPSLETEIRQALKARADQEAYDVFKKNLKDVLMAPPAVGKVVLGVDPGFRSGTKLAVVDATGKFLQEKTIYPIPPQNEAEASKTILLAMIESFKIEIIAIGNGTASREIDEFIGNSIKELENPPIKMVVNESGASVYSASPTARKEFPELDVTIRGAISIARRIQDPLAELVKIDPKSIGVGQYQHDVNQKDLKEKLENVVQSCVNSVGVNVNSASENLLGYVSGVDKALAKKIIEHRDKNGPFKSRASFVKVSHFGPKAFEQAAGFLRIMDAENPLDGTSVHPERYTLVQKICDKEGVPLAELISNGERVKQIKLKQYQSEEVGLPTLIDIKEELEKPNRDPRKKFTYANFNPDVKEISDLKEESWLEGVVTNITDFGVFVDLGVHQDGMIHISELSDKYAGRNRGNLSAGTIVKVRVISVDVEQKRISLSMRETNAKPRPKRPRKKKPTVNQLKSKFATDDREKRNNVKLKFSVKSIMKSGR